MVITEVPENLDKKKKRKKTVSEYKRRNRNKK